MLRQGDSDDDYYIDKGVRGQDIYYPGSNRYTYYLDNKPRYYYSDRVLTEKDIRSASWFVLKFGAIMTLIFCTFLLYSCKFTMGGKLDISGIDSSILISDYGNFMNSEDEDELRDCLEKFRDKTGVIISIVTSNDTTIGGTIEERTHELYRSMFYDDSHWLVYCVSDNNYRDGYWYYYLVCGDNCVQVLNKGQEDRFIKALRNNLNRNISLSEAIIESVNILRPSTLPWFVFRGPERTNGTHMANERVGIEGLAVLAFIAIGMVIFISGVYGLVRPLTEEEKAKMSAVRVKGELVTVICTRCGKIYNINPSVSMQCSNCGNIIAYSDEAVK